MHHEYFQIMRPDRAGCPTCCSRATSPRGSHGEGKTLWWV